jgi:2-polyprenyl-6-hydroxyphenyl methylase/3-demethylubiquinone-9 3-methyltransferase
MPPASSVNVEIVEERLEMPTDPADIPKPQNAANWDHSSDPIFLSFYERESASQQTVQRFSIVRDKALGLLAAQTGSAGGVLQVADIGCGAGTQCRLWAKLGHRVHGLDVNAPLIAVAEQRAREENLRIVFDVGTATDLPYPDSSMDVALLPELLEHVANWQDCCNEAVRILKPGGLLYLSTTNWLCPVQDEFNLPLYSWYPGFLKQKYERLAISTRPDIANYCKYPAVNWFSVYSLKKFLEKRGFRCMDRFDLMETKDKGVLFELALALIRLLPPLRFIAHVFTPGSLVFAIKKSSSVLVSG